MAEPHPLQVGDPVTAVAFHSAHGDLRPDLLLGTLVALGKGVATVDARGRQFILPCDWVRHRAERSPFSDWLDRHLLVQPAHTQ